jgi:AcrR family transcriptional regulator
VPDEAKGVRARQAAQTRERILAAAKELFADRGYEATTVRAIAAAAKADPAAVIRHFGSKEQLFYEVLHRQSVYPALEDVPDERIGEEVIRVFLTDWEHRDRAPMLALFRAALSGGQVAEHVRQAFMDSTLSHLNTRCKQDEHAEKRLALVAVDVIGFVVNRYVLELDPLASMPADDVVKLLGPRLQRHMRGPLDGL